MGAIKELVEQSLDGYLGEQEIELQLNDPEISNTAVMGLRLLITLELKANAEFYLPFLDGFSDIGSFCSTSVDPMGEECDNVHMTALCARLGVAVDVVYITETGAESENIRFGPETENVFASFLYRPGHYDLLC